MLSFVTGSRAYGAPKQHSDIDLVVLVSQQDFSKLMEMSEGSTVSSSDPGPTTPGNLSGSFRFGKLNLLALTCPIAYGVWAKGTQELKERSAARGTHVTRQEAISLFDSMLVKHGLRKEEKKKEPESEKPKYAPGKLTLEQLDIGEAVEATKKVNGVKKTFAGVITDINHEDEQVMVSYRGEDRWCEPGILTRIPINRLFTSRVKDE